MFRLMPFLVLLCTVGTFCTLVNWYFLLIVPLLWLPRLVSCRSSSTLLLPWDVTPPGA